jgi:hypothetical protein
MKRASRCFIILHLNCFTKRICSRRSHSQNQAMFPYYKRPFVPALTSQAAMRTAECPVSSADPLDQSVLKLTWVRVMSLSNIGRKRGFRGFPRSPYRNASLVPRVKQRPLLFMAGVSNSQTSRLCYIYNVIYVSYICKLYAGPSGRAV